MVEFKLCIVMSKKCTRLRSHFYDVESLNCSSVLICAAFFCFGGHTRAVLCWCEIIHAAHTMGVERNQYGGATVAAGERCAAEK